MQCGRRVVTRAMGLGLLGCWSTATSEASATLVRGLTLREMVRSSAHVLLLEAGESYCHWQVLGGRRMIVTDTSIRILDSLGSAAPAAPEATVRTLGGRVGEDAELVFGQPDFGAAGVSVAFLTRAEDDVLWATGMAQGHYPLRAQAGAQVLTASSHLPQMRRLEGSAVQSLHRTKLDVARRLVREAGAR